VLFVLAEASVELLDAAILLFEAVFELLNVVVFSGKLVVEGVVRRTAFLTLLQRHSYVNYRLTPRRSRWGYSAVFDIKRFNSLPSFRQYRRIQPYKYGR
jgi:hypothetical protein